MKTEMQESTNNNFSRDTKIITDERLKQSEPSRMLTRVKSLLLETNPELRKVFNDSRVEIKLVSDMKKAINAMGINTDGKYYFFVSDNRGDKRNVEILLSPSSMKS